MLQKSNQGFTLIELLVVVAVIAILAAIGVPNYLEAQVRSKVSRVKADLRTLATSLEAYNADTNGYPLFMYRDGTMKFPVTNRLIPLSTPVAYLTIVPPRDPFTHTENEGAIDTYDYADAESFRLQGEPEPSYRTRGAAWRLASSGPDLLNTWGGPLAINPPGNPGYDYDPTNGTVSKGDIVRVGPKSPYPGNFLYPDQVF
jgi:prepilin-type N-terminal cleavage/methylation domain-containing protein